MVLCITEKPSVARDIAAVIGATTRRDGHYEGAGYCVTWTFGHLCTLKEPADYSDLWRRWSLSALPMLPQRFGIKLIDDDGIRRQFEHIKSLAAQADEIINCGDAGQEGELIQRWVMQLAEVKCPVKRLWISSLTDEAVRKGFETLQPQQHYDTLYHAGLSRAIGDWILGLNATRLYTLKYSNGATGSVLSIGRVQTPTLALVVARQLEIANFKPEDYYELRTVYRDATFNATGGRFKSLDAAQRALQAVAAQPLTITDVLRKHGRENPPRLFDLTSLQVEANRRWGWTADETLQLIQSLYERKLTTYPRVDTTYLPEELYAKTEATLRALTPYAPLTAPLLAAKIIKPKRIFDSSKVTDHHAIIPTGQNPAGTTGREAQLYHLIALRYIAAFYPDCEFDTTVAMARAADVEFKAQGKVIVKPGWRSVLAPSPADGVEGQADNADRQTLPPFTPGESGPHTPAIHKGTTTPPKPYTEATLLRAMETAGRTIDDDEALREAMKQNGIGRPSTRAAIIETLFRRRYMRRERKNIIATQAGIDLIATITEPLLKSARLTGIWEQRLRAIERGTESPARFIDDLKAQISRIVVDVLADNSRRRILAEAEGAEPKEKEAAAKEKKPRARRITRYDQIVCPECGSGHILKGRTAFGCSRYAEGCTLRLPFEQYPAELTPGKLRAKLAKK